MPSLRVFVVLITCLCFHQIPVLANQENNPLVAVVLNNKVYALDIEPKPDEMSSVNMAEYTRLVNITNKIIQPLVNNYAETVGLKASDEEVEEVIKFWELSGMRQKGVLKSEKEIERAKEMVVNWKIKRALHQKYGGRSAMGMTDISPTDAIRSYVYEQEQAGNLKLVDENTKKLLQYALAPEEHEFMKDRFYDEARSSESYKSPYWRKILESKKARELSKS